MGTRPRTAPSRPTRRRSSSKQSWAYTTYPCQSPFGGAEVVDDRPPLLRMPRQRLSSRTLHLVEDLSSIQSTGSMYVLGVRVCVSLRSIELRCSDGCLLS